MRIRVVRRILLFILILFCGVGAADSVGAEESRPPNVVIIFTDDQGYGDVGVYGAKGYTTPNLDRMASEGRRFTSFLVAQAVCSSSRVGLLTGCYPNRLNVVGALFPGSNHGIHDEETTIAEVLKQRGYATAIYGKWHLGHHKQFLPTRHGFDDYLGLPYSNDMWPPNDIGGPDRRFPPLPLVEDDEVIHPNVTAEIQTQLTTWYTERAVRFIEDNKDRPFFLYVPHAQPHVPLYVSEKFRGKSEQGTYGDVMMEIDWSVGQILDAIERSGIDEQTLVIFTTDNGPWLVYGDHGGSAGPLREGKATAWEGGFRVPCIMRWPGKIPAGSVCKEPAMTIDLLPTIANIVGAPMPSRSIDGKDIWPLIVGEPGARNPHDAYYYYMGFNLNAVRSGPWKLVLPHTYITLNGGHAGSGGKRGVARGGKASLALYNLESDIGETTDLSSSHPQIVKRLMGYVERARADLGDGLTQRKGAGVREPGRIAAAYGELK